MLGDGAALGGERRQRTAGLFADGAPVAQMLCRSLGVFVVSLLSQVGVKSGAQNDLFVAVGTGDDKAPNGADIAADNNPRD